MKKTILPLTAIVLALLGLQACGAKLNPDNDEKTKTESQKSDNNNFFILQSNASALGSAAEELKAQKAQLRLNAAADSHVDISIEYAFADEGGKNAHTFTLGFANVPFVSEGGIIRFDAKDLTASCLADGKTADAASFSLSGSLGGEKPSLSLDGSVNGFPFTLNMPSISASQDAFVPQFMETAIVDRIPLVELGITNTAAGKVYFLMKSDTISDIHLALEPGETQVFYAFLEEFPLHTNVEIIYEDGTKIIFSGEEWASIDHLKKESEEKKWCLTKESGAIIPIDFTHMNYSIN